MRKLISIALVFCLSACAGTPDAKSTCLRRAASAEIAVTESYESTVSLLKAGLIDKGAARASLKATDGANAAVDSAGRFCQIDEPKATDYLKEAAALLTQAAQIRGEQ